MNLIKFNLEDLKKDLNGFSCYILGRSYDLEENDVTKDYKKALSYYQKGISYNHPLCEYSLGISLLFGLEDILEKDEYKANKLLINAYPRILDLINNPKTSFAERLYAKFVTGAYYYFGLGNIKKDYNKAFKVIKECADNGHIAAIYDLGANFYYNGIGTIKDLNKANYYLNIAKEANLPRAIKKYKEYKYDE